MNKPWQRTPSPEHGGGRSRRVTSHVCRCSGLWPPRSEQWHVPPGTSSGMKWGALFPCQRTAVLHLPREEAVREWRCLRETGHAVGCTLWFPGAADGETRVPAILGLVFGLFSQLFSEGKRSPGVPQGSPELLPGLEAPSHGCSQASRWGFRSAGGFLRGQLVVASGFCDSQDPSSWAPSTGALRWAWCWAIVSAPAVFWAFHEMLVVSFPLLSRQLRHPPSVSFGRIWGIQVPCSCYQKFPECFVFASIIPTFSFLLGRSFVHSTDLKYNFFLFPSFRACS